MLTTLKPDAKDINKIQTNLKKSCAEFNKSELNDDSYKKLYKG